MKKISLFLVVVMVFALVAVGCAPKAEEPAASEEPAAAEPAAEEPSAEEPSAEEPAEKITIGFSQVTLDSPFYVALMDKAEETAKAMGAELIYLDAQGDVAKQNNDIIDLISKGMDVLILNPVDADGVAPALAECEKNNVPVMTVDRSVNGDYVTLVGRDNAAMGKLMGEYAVELLGGKGKAEGKILEVQGAAGCNVMMARRDGFHEAVDAEAGLEVIQSTYCDYTRSKAVTAVQDLLQANPDIKLIYAHNDDMSLGALQVFEDAGKEVFVLGVDGLMEAVQAIADGRYNATTINDPGVLGKIAVETAIKIVNGEEVPEYIDGGTGVIEADNAADYIDDSKMFAEIK